MFQLRDEHQEAFEAAALAGFERRAVAHVRANFPDESSKLTDHEIRASARDGLRRSKAYGFETERQVMRFVDTGFLIGPDFDTREDAAWTRMILNSVEDPVEQRSRWLLACAQRAVKEQGTPES